MSDSRSNQLSGLDVEQARRIDEVCLCFEARWREGSQPCVEDYLGPFTEDGRAALRAQLDALQRRTSRKQSNAVRGSHAPFHRCRSSDDSAWDRTGAAENGPTAVIGP